MSETTANFLEIPKGASQDMTFLTMKAGSMAYRFSYLRKSCYDHIVENLGQDQYDMMIRQKFPDGQIHGFMAGLA